MYGMWLMKDYEYLVNYITLEFCFLSPSYPYVTLQNWSSTDRHKMVSDVTRLNVGVEWTATKGHKTPIHRIQFQGFTDVI